MPQVVGPHLHLEAIFRLAQRQRHHAGVVDEDVDDRRPLAQRRRAGAHRGEIAQIEGDLVDLGAARLGAHALGGRFHLAEIAARQDDPRALPGEHARRLEADAAVSAGDDDGAATKGRDRIRSERHGPRSLSQGVVPSKRKGVG